MKQIQDIMRPTDVPDAGLLCDRMWSDPDADITGWAENDRGVSYTFGADVVGKFLQKHEFDNAGAVMAVDESLMCSFRILKPADKKKYAYGGMGSGRPLTPPRKR